MTLLRDDTFQVGVVASSEDFGEGETFESSPLPVPEVVNPWNYYTLRYQVGASTDVFRVCGVTVVYTLP